MHVVITVVHPRDTLHDRHHALYLTSLDIPFLPVVQILCPTFAPDEVIGFDGVIPDADVPLEGERGRVEDDEQEEEGFDCDVSTG